MRKVNCPVCGGTLMSVADNEYVDFDMRHWETKHWCSRCKRNIKIKMTKREGTPQWSAICRDKEQK